MTAQGTPTRKNRVLGTPPKRAERAETRNNIAKVAKGFMLGVEGRALGYFGRIRSTSP